MTPLPEGIPQAALEAVANGVVITDAQGTILWVNAAFTRMTGYSSAEAIGQTPRLLKSGEHPPAFYRELWSTIASGKGWTGEMTNRRKDGSVYVEEQTITPVRDAGGNPAYFIAVKQDRTLRRRADGALRRSEERYRLLAENISDVIGLYDLGMNAVYVSPSVQQLRGFTPDEVIARPMIDQLAPGSRDLAMRVFREEMEIERSGRGDPARSRMLEFEMLCKDGTTVWTESKLTTVRDSSGSLTGVIGVSRDITERKRVEGTLRDTSQTLRTLIDASVLAIVALDRDGRVTLWNNAATRLFGWSAEEVLGRPLPTVPEDRRAEFEDGRVRSLTGEDVIYETQRRRKDGSLVDVLRSSAFIFDPQGERAGSMAIFVDITERKQLEEQLRQAVKMEGIGRLAGGIAHDFNNLLTVIGGRSYLLLSQLPAGHAMRRDLLLIQQTGDRAAALTRQLLAFSRKQTLAPAVIDLNEIVSGMRTLLERVLGEDVDVIMDLDPALGHVTADPGQIEQVILNMAVNARDAMPEGGQLTLETRHVDVDPTYARQQVELAPGPYEVLSISDTRVGMDAATVARAFEPFFTTKAVGKGTGLGLATAYGIVKQSGGHITVYSEPGSGTTLRVYLSRTETSESAPVAAEEAAARRGTEVVLLAEDDANLRALTRDILASSGYTVLESQDVEDALRIAERQDGTIHLLLTDVVMPHMSGRVLAEAVKRFRPDVKVLYMSGYTDNAIVHHGVLDPGTALLQKPFTPAALARKVREELDRPQ
ncbi:MAG: PAS domain S-box protein [Candidatus Rokubacteria bacterium]|nr:PAS domain S-box protein [Candidatus Rokubacteria bacterium]